MSILSFFKILIIRGSFLFHTACFLFFIFYLQFQCNLAYRQNLLTYFLKIA